MEQYRFSAFGLTWLVLFVNNKMKSAICEGIDVAPDSQIEKTIREIILEQKLQPLA